MRHLRQRQLRTHPPPPPPLADNHATENEALKLTIKSETTGEPLSGIKSDTVPSCRAVGR